MNTHKKKIVILGGGFGGLYTYKSLYEHFSPDEIEVTIVNRTNYFLFTPLLHEVATGSISHHQVVESIRQIIYKTNDKLHVAEIISVDHTNHVVTTSIGALSYDILVVALGATTNFFNTQGAQEHSLVLKDLSDAIKLRATLIDAFEKASEIADPEIRASSLTFAVIGGGPTGVELITEVAELFNETFIKYYHGRITPKDVSLYLINQSPEILGPFPVPLRHIALNVLAQSGVKVKVSTGVTEVTKDGVVLDNGTLLPVAHVIWTAGVKPHSALLADPVPLDKGGRVIVNRSLQVEGIPDMFVIGDIASFTQTTDEHPLPMLAQVAVKQGIHTGYNIKRLVEGSSLLPFVYTSQGSLVSLGQWRAVADIHGFRFSGPVAWFMWRTIYLFKFLSGSKKVKIVADWTMNIFYPRDITKA